MWKRIATIAVLAFSSGMVFSQSVVSSGVSSPIPVWFTDILLAVVGSAIAWILTQIKSSIASLNAELKSTNNNLSRLDRRVAFLEGRFFRFDSSDDAHSGESGV